MGGVFKTIENVVSSVFDGGSPKAPSVPPPPSIGDSQAAATAQAQQQAQQQAQAINAFGYGSTLGPSGAKGDASQNQTQKKQLFGS